MLKNSLFQFINLYSYFLESEKVYKFPVSAIFFNRTIYRMGLDTFLAQAKICGQTVLLIENLYYKFPFISLGTKMFMVDFPYYSIHTSLAL